MCPSEKRLFCTSSSYYVQVKNGNLGAEIRLGYAVSVALFFIIKLLSIRLILLLYISFDIYNCEQCRFVGLVRVIIKEAIFSEYFFFYFILLVLLKIL